MINKLVANIKKTGAPIVVGLDPNLAFVPEHIQKKAFDEYGETLEGAAEAIWQFNKAIVDAVYDLIPAVKPQIAMYEQFGLPGLEAFHRTVEYCRQKDLVIIGDIKRGDIGSTSEAYARGHLGPVKVGSRSLYGFNEDFVTLNPYMGSDSINPFINTAKKEKKGAFILVKTSNPSSGEFQDRLIDGRPLFEYVAEKVNEWGSDYVGECGYSYVGAVVGATYPEQARITRKLMPKAYILVPGYGAQGATAKDLLPNFDENGLGAIVNSSRGIIAAYKQEKYAKFDAEHFADASRAAVIDMQKDFIDGSLGTKEAQAIVPAVKEKIENFNGDIIFTKDTHGEDYMNTQEGQNLPIPHCIKGTPGHEIINELQPYVKKALAVFEKETFGSRKLANFLKELHKEKEIESIELIGLCTDICVVSNALLIKAFLPEVPILADSNCCAGVTPEKHESALETMRSCQILVCEAAKQTNS